MSKQYGGVWGAAYDVTIWRIRIASWISRATCMYAPGCTRARTHKYVIFIAFPRGQLFANAPCYVIRTLPVLFLVSLISLFFYRRSTERCVYLAPVIRCVDEFSHWLEVTFALRVRYLLVFCNFLFCGWRWRTSKLEGTVPVPEATRICNVLVYTLCILCLTQLRCWSK
jgi:hypothetical protein